MAVVCKPSPSKPPRPVPASSSARSNIQSVPMVERSTIGSVSRQVGSDITTLWQMSSNPNLDANRIAIRSSLQRLGLQLGLLPSADVVRVYRQNEVAIRVLDKRLAAERQMNVARLITAGLSCGQEEGYVCTITREMRLASFFYVFPFIPLIYSRTYGPDRPVVELSKYFCYLDSLQLTLPIRRSFEDSLEGWGESRIPFSDGTLTLLFSNALGSF